MLSHQRRPDDLEFSGATFRSVADISDPNNTRTSLMLRSMVTRHSMSYASPPPTGCTWLKSSPAAKHMLGKPAVSLVLQPQQRHGAERVHMPFVRCMASSRGSDDKSWSELASMPLPSSLPSLAALMLYLQQRSSRECSDVLQTRHNSTRGSVRHPSPCPVSVGAPIRALHTCITTIHDTTLDILCLQVRQQESPKAPWASSDRPSATL